MFRLIWQRNFGLLWAGGLVSAAGNWLLSVALPIHLYDLTHSTALTSLLFIARIVPVALVGSVAGVFVDRWNRRYVMLFTDAVQIVAVLPFILVTSGDLIWIAFACSFLQSGLGAFFAPAKNALVPTLVGEDNLTAANSLITLTEQLTILIGPALGAILVVWLGWTNIVLVDSATYVVSVATLALIHSPARAVQPEPEKVAGRRLSRFWQEWRAGFGVIRSNQFLSALLIVLAVATVGGGLYQVLMVTFVEKVLHGGATERGWLIAAQGAGGIMGALWLPRLQKTLSVGQLMALSAIVSSVFLIMQLLVGWWFGNSYLNIGPLSFSAFLLVVGLGALSGIAVAGFDISLFTAMQAQLEDQYRGRVISTFITTATFMQTLGMALSSPLEAVFGTVLTLILSNSLFISAGLVMWRLLPDHRTSRPAEINVLEEISP